MYLHLPENLSILELIKFAKAHGMRVRWVTNGLKLKPTMEPDHAHRPAVGHPHLHLVGSQPAQA